MIRCNYDLMTRTCMAVVSIVAVCTSAPVFAQEYVEIAKLVAPNAIDGDEEFGRSVAIDGNTMVVGSFDRCAASDNCGAAYVYQFNGVAWIQEAKLTASDAAAFDYLGHSVAISGDTIVAGAFFDDCPAGSFCGSAYVFVKSGGGWSDMTETAKLTASDAAGGDNFGHSVSISGDTIVAGAFWDDCATGQNCGSAYVFVKPGAVWINMTETAKLTASDPTIDDYLGWSVSVSGDTIVAGVFNDECAAGADCGSAYVFAKPGAVWINMTQTAKLTASDAAINDYLARSVSISGDTIVAGTSQDGCPAGIWCGAAYVFVKPGVSWSDMTQTAKLTASDAAAQDYFGFSVSISGDTIVVGAFGDDCVAGGDCGSAYIFVKTPLPWFNTTQTAKLTASDAAVDDYFGYAVGISGDTTVVGAYFDDCTAGFACGAAYVFGPPPIFVDANAGGLNDGSSWTNAYKFLRDALAVAVFGSQIWVAEGTYKPTDKSCAIGADCPNGICPIITQTCTWNAPREQTFQLLNGVTIYGGFTGFENSLSERDIENNPTILSGDVSNNDVLVFCTQHSPDCDSFGGICLFNSCITTDDNDENSYHIVTGSSTNATAILDGFLIRRGNANGGGAQQSGGGGMLNDAGSPTIANCTFTENFGTSLGGGMWSRGASPTLTNCTISQNSNSGVRLSNGGHTTFDNCTIENNSAAGVASGGGLFAVEADCTMRNSVLRGNDAEGSGGGAYLQTGTFTFLNTTIADNTAGNNGGGGGVRMELSVNAAFTNCSFLSNQSGFGGGGGMANYSSGIVSLANCRFVGNTTIDNGGGIHNDFFPTPPTFSVTNCTFHGNSAQNFGGGISFGNPTGGTIDNCIFSGNTDISGMGATSQIQDSAGGSSPIVNHSVVQGEWTGAGSNNINANPLFVDPDGADNLLGTEDDNVRLQASSPAIDAGDSCAYPIVVDLGDLDGNDRMVGYAIDMGAYENQSVLGGDCNRNGSVDQFDICSEASEDVDADGSPDECTQFDGGCGGNNAWSCNLNWEDNTVPNNGAETFSVTLETPADAACLDIDVTLDTLIIADGASLDMSGQDGCDGTLMVVKPGGLFIDGRLTDMGPCMMGGSSARGGHTPPSLTIRGPGSTTTILYSLILEGIVEFLHGSTTTIVLGGDFDNRCTSLMCINLREGGVTLTGVVPEGPSQQRFEAAAPDAGPIGTLNAAEHANGRLEIASGADEDWRGGESIMSIGTLEIASGADVTFSDTFDNDGNGQVGSCTEAVYVSTLRVGSPATITLDNVRVYYVSLDPDPLDPGVIVNTIGCGELVPVTCPSVVAAVQVDPINNRNRYLSINPGNAGESVALRVSVVSAPTVPSLVLEQRWVGMPVSVPDPPGGGNIFVAPLQCDPLFMNFGAFGTIHVFGPAVVPSTLSPTQYEVVVVPQSCSAFSGAYSAPLSITQAKWGDIVTPFGGISQPNFNDINAIVDKFRNLGSAPTITRVDLVGPGNNGIPNTPNHTVNFGDISACVDAFRTFPYPFTATTCP